MSTPFCYNVFLSARVEAAGKCSFKKKKKNVARSSPICKDSEKHVILLP